MNILKIVFSNIRKRKGASITFLVMVMLSSLMLSISLSLIIGSGDFYDKKTEELQSPHWSNYIVENRYQDDFKTFAENYDGVTKVSVLDALVCTGTWNMKLGTNNATIVLGDENQGNERSFQKLKRIDESTADTEGRILLPINFKSGGFRSGEKISFTLNEKEYEFTIHGFFEDTLMGASTTGASIVYLDTKTYQKLDKDKNFANLRNLQVRFKESEKCNDFEKDFSKMSKLIPSEGMLVKYTDSKTNALMFINTMLMILIIFSTVILFIAFIVAKFSINNSIQEDIITIGALKSIGYKNKALRGSQMIQYLLIAVLGSFLGTLISHFTFGFIGNIIASTSSLLWITGANIISILLTILVACGLTSFIIFIVTRKYKKITPINALRQGESNHSFKKNKIPLYKYKIPLPLHLGIKRFLRSAKNNITLFFVVSLLTFVSVFVFSMSYNLNYDKTAMIQMIGLEMAGLWVQPSPDTDIDDITSEINTHDEVKSTLLSGSLPCLLDGYDSYVKCFEDYSALTTNTIIQGRYPELYNEITLGATVANTVGKQLGDTVTLELLGNKMEYIVAGITQDIGSGGASSLITETAMKKQYSEFKMDMVYIYLKDDVKGKDYKNKLTGIYGSQILTADPAESVETMLNSWGGPFASISIIMLVVTVIIIGFVLFLILSALIRKDKKEIGIMKAIGYKNRQLSIQLLISLLPSLLLGIIIGVVFGFVLVNPMFSVFMSSSGLLDTYFIIPVLPAILISLGIFIISIFMAYFICFRLKKISPQKLIVEQ